MDRVIRMYWRLSLQLQQRTSPGLMLVCVCVRFLSKESAERVFFPQRFIGRCRRGDTPLSRIHYM